MAELDITTQVATDSQQINTREFSRIFVYGNRTVSKTYINVSGDVESVSMGQVVGVIATGVDAGKWTVSKSAATDGSQIPRGILTVSIVEAADDQEVSVDICVGGDVNKNEIVFDGTDTFDTLVGGVRMEDLLIANSQSLVLKTVTDLSGYANY